MQIGQGASPFGVAKLWRRVQGDDPSPVRVGAPGPTRPPAAMSAAPTPPRINLTVMSGEDLERHLTGLFGRRGYTVWPVPSRGEIGSALLICRGDQGVAVQVKRWNAPLGPEVVRAVLAALQHHSGTLARLGCSQMGAWWSAPLPSAMTRASSPPRAESCSGTARSSRRSWPPIWLGRGGAPEPSRRRTGRTGAPDRGGLTNRLRRRSGRETARSWPPGRAARPARRR